MTSRTEVVLTVGENQKMMWKMIITIEKVRNQLNRSGAKWEQIKLEIRNRNRQKFSIKSEIQSKYWLALQFCLKVGTFVKTSVHTEKSSLKLF